MIPTNAPRWQSTVEQQKREMEINVPPFVICVLIPIEHSAGVTRPCLASICAVRHNTLAGAMWAPGRQHFMVPNHSSSSSSKQHMDELSTAATVHYMCTVPCAHVIM